MSFLAEGGFLEDSQPVSQKKTQDDKGITALTCIFVTVMVFGIVGMVPEKTQGVVVKRDKNLLYVKNLQDTSKYVVFSNDLCLKPYGAKAFPYVNVGDTLDYGTQAASTVKFDQVKRINSQKLADFVKEREKMQRSVSEQKTR